MSSFDRFLSFLKRPAHTIPGVGGAQQKMLKKLDITSFWDVIAHRPVGTQDRHSITSLKDAIDGTLVTLVAQPTAFPGRTAPGKPRHFPLQTERGEILDLVYFRPPSPFVLNHLKTPAPLVVSGQVSHFKNQYQMVHPDHVGALSSLAGWVGVQTLYPLTAGLTHRRMGFLAQYVLERLPTPPEWLDDDTCRRHRFDGFKQTLLRLHHPTSAGDLDPNGPVLRRLAFDELLAHQLALILSRREQATGGKAIAPPGPLCQGVLDTLPFDLTADQRVALNAIAKDLSAPEPMVRLLQGDVGSGKTVVALLTMIQAVEDGYQAALMAPTEILARQHGATFIKLAPAFKDRIAVLTARSSGKERQKILEGLANGEIALVIGTHALIQDDVCFHRLGYTVIDEQHRFGIEQRVALIQKGRDVDILSMTATPIPRTLMLAFYGDLPCSYLREKPKNRGRITTTTFPLTRIDEVLTALRRPLGRDERIYWVCPLIDESETLDLQAAEERYAALHALFGSRVGLLHGRMKSKEKDAVMDRFVRGEYRILVSTTVIEVGVDVPNATVMVIEQAERFGLAQLHQLRGRIGRSHLDSACLLLYGFPLSHTASTRLKMMCTTNDGFQLAEEDLKLRGGGDVLGRRQSGMPSFKFADLFFHQDLLRDASQKAKTILTADPNLSAPENAPLRLLVTLFSEKNERTFLSAG